MTHHNHVEHTTGRACLLPRPNGQAQQVAGHRPPALVVQPTLSVFVTPAMLVKEVTGGLLGADRELLNCALLLVKRNEWQLGVEDSIFCMDGYAHNRGTSSTRLTRGRSVHRAAG